MESIIDRRVFFKIAATGVAGYFVSPLQTMAQTVTTTPGATILGTARNCIFVLLAGGPSHIDTLDLRVGSWTPKDFAPTTINGIDWPNGLLPNLGAQLNSNRFSVIRSCQSIALVHALLQNWNQIARNPANATGKIAPNIGSVVALEMEPQRKTGQKLPGFLSLNGGGSLAGAGYFSGKYAPFDVSPSANGLSNLNHPDGEAVFTTRYNMLMAGDALLRGTPSPIGTTVDEMSEFYTSAKNMMYDPTVNNAFRFSAADQQKYGNSSFGGACVTARNVLAADLGVRYIQITLGGWDNHTNIYAPNNGIYPSARQLDAGLGNLIADLASMPGSQGANDARRYPHGGQRRIRPHCRKYNGWGRTGSLLRPFHADRRRRCSGWASAGNDDPGCRVMSMIQAGPSNDPCMRKISQPQFILRWVSITRRFVTTIRSVADLSTSRKTRRGWEHQ